MKNKLLIFLVCLFLAFMSPELHAQEQPQKTQAEFTNLAMDAFKKREATKAFEYLAESIEAYPDHAGARMNFASMSYQFVLDLRKQNAPEEQWLPFTEGAFQQFHETIRLSKNMKGEEEELGNWMAAHATFLIGDMYVYLFNDKVKGREYIEKALEINPTSPDAKRELDKLNNN